MSPELLSAIAACLSFCATCAAAWTAWKGPQKAAELAEELRKKSIDQDEKRRMRLWIFTTVMQFRASIWSSDCVRALNLIDFAFVDSPDVRRSWARLINAYEPQSGSSENEKRNHLRDLLDQMASTLSLKGLLADADFDRTYHPNAMVETELAQMFHRQAIIKANTSDMSTNQRPALPAIFPPRPG